MLLNLHVGTLPINISRFSAVSDPIRFPRRSDLSATLGHGEIHLISIFFNWIHVHSFLTLSCPRKTGTNSAGGLDGTWDFQWQQHRYGLDCIFNSNVWLCLRNAWCTCKSETTLRCSCRRVPILRWGQLKADQPILIHTLYI